jgi:SEN1 N terminal
MRGENEIMDELQGLDGYAFRPPPRSPPSFSIKCRLVLTKFSANKFSESELKSFHPDAHWFCPKRNDDDHIDYDNPSEPEEDMSPETKLELIQDTKRRHDVAYKYSLILGLSPDIAGVLLVDYTDRLNMLLTTCDKCVHNWHMGRKAYLKELTEYVLSLCRTLDF